MDTIELIYRLTVALAIGLLIGIERGWTTRGEAEGERTAGLRTFALIGLLGGVLGALAIAIPGGVLVLGAGLVVIGAIIAAFRHREMVHDKTFGATTVVASVTVLALGALAATGAMEAAAAAGVAMAGLLALKSALHGWLKALTWEELRSALILLAMSLILLPVLPNRGFGPYGALNPYELWLMTVLIAAVSAAGYGAMKWVGGNKGVGLSALAGGLVSSTAVTVSFAQLAREQPERANVLLAGAALANATMMGRVLLVAGATGPAVLGYLILPIGLAAAATATWAGLSFWRRENETLQAPLVLKSPFDLGTVLKFGLFLSAVVLAAKILTELVGGAGALALSAVSGIADVDAVTLTMSRLAGQGLTADTAALAILIAVAVNTISKVCLGWMAGGAGPGRRLALAGVIALAAGLAGLAATHVLGPLDVREVLQAGRGDPQPVTG